jgi:raffinose/stachyose/melibiose transport system permease protein
MNKLRKTVGHFFVNLLVILFSITCIFPIIWTFYSSFKSKGEFLGNIIGLPKSPQFTSYQMAVDLMDFGRKFFNSAFNTVVSMFFIIVFAMIMGYFLSRYHFRGRMFVYFLILFGMLVPIHGFLVPVYLQFKEWNLLDTRFTLILPYVAFELPIAVFLMESFMHSIPIDVEEAAIIDGANINQRMFRVVFPMCKPIISTIAILSFLHVWNEFPFGLVLINDDALKTLPVSLTVFKGQYEISYPNIMAGLMLSSIPVILFYLMFSKKVTDGMVAGAVKG